ncbi:zinc finger, SWIM domain protein [Roseiflexus sp. RS-1]|nr:zinc finger, SWIM domain protein [Roseiflexus sp. RS-1]
METCPLCVPGGVDVSRLPDLDKQQIRERAGAQSWTRGLAYFAQGAVRQVVWREGVLTAQVVGSHHELYRVTVRFDAQGAIINAECTCPYDWGGDCKHIVATLLYLLNRPEQVEQRPDLTSLLAPLDAEQLTRLVVQLVAVHPDLIDDVEELLATLATPSTSATVSLPVDLAVLQRRIRADMRRLLRDYDTGDYYEDVIDLGEALMPAIEVVGDLLSADDARGALAVLEAGTIAWLDGCQWIDHDSMGDVIGFASDTLATWGELWAEALLRADLEPQESQRWARTLQTWNDALGGGYALLIAATAAEQGWRYPPLVAAMQGHPGEHGIWEGDRPRFADKLVTIRLRILQARGRYEEYLNLARAERRFLDYLKMLVTLGRREAAAAEARTYLTDLGDILAIAQTLIDHGDVEKALDLATHGLTLNAPHRQREGLARWLRDEAARHGRRDLALHAGWIALGAYPLAEHYRWLRTWLHDEWDRHREQALQTVELASANINNIDEQVEIYLMEQMFDKAMALVEKNPWSSKLGQVIDAVRATHPRWAFEQCYRQAAAIMDRGLASAYINAITWLRQGRDILLVSGQHDVWNTVLNDLIQKHYKKYKLRPMLEQLRR